MTAIFLHRTKSHLVFRITLQGKPIKMSLPASLVDQWGPHPIDGATIACGDEGAPPSVPISEGCAGSDKRGEDGVTREHEEQGPMV